MSLEAASTISQLNPANPSGADLARMADDHLRLIKAVIKANLGEANDVPLTTKLSFLNSLTAELTPMGAIMLFAGSEAPEGWAICDGSTVDRSDGTGTITTSDLRGRAPVGANTAHPLGSTWGTESRTLMTEAAGGHTHEATLTNAGDHKHNVEVDDTILTIDEMPANRHANSVTDAGTNLSAHRSITASPREFSPQGGGVWTSRAAVTATGSASIRMLTQSQMRPGSIRPGRLVRPQRL